MTEHYITIPCELAKEPDRVAPRLVYVGEDWTGAHGCYEGYREKAAPVPAARCLYECPYCGMRNPRRRPLANHMGLNMNIPASCPVLKRQDAARRQTLNPKRRNHAHAIRPESQVQENAQA